MIAARVALPSRIAVTAAYPATVTIELSDARYGDDPAPPPSSRRSSCEMISPVRQAWTRRPIDPGTSSPPRRGVCADRPTGRRASRTWLCRCGTPVRPGPARLRARKRTCSSPPRAHRQPRTAHRDLLHGGRTATGPGRSTTATAWRYGDRHRAAGWRSPLVTPTRRATCPRRSSIGPLAWSRAAAPLCTATRTSAGSAHRPRRRTGRNGPPRPDPPRSGRPPVGERSSRRRGLRRGSASVGEVAGAGEVHRDPGRRGRLDDLLVADRAAGRTTARTPASSRICSPSANGKNASDAATAPARPLRRRATPRAGRSRPG